MMRWEATGGEPKLKWSQQCPSGFLWNLLIKSSWNFILAPKLSVCVPRTSILFFCFSLWQLSKCQMSKSWKTLKRLFAFHFGPFSGSFCKCVLGSAFRRHTSLPFVVGRSASLWQCLAINTTGPLRWRLGSSRVALPLPYVLQTQGYTFNSYH